MKWDGQTSAVVGSAVVTIATVIGTAIALGTMMQTEHARINSDIRELRAGLGELDQRIDARLDGLGERMARVETLVVNIDQRLYRLENHIFGIEPEILPDRRRPGHPAISTQSR